MKKFILCLLMAVIYSLPYAMKCEKCIEEKTTFCGIAHRDFEKPVIDKDGHSYAIYKCEYGHLYLVQIK